MPRNELFIVRTSAQNISQFTLTLVYNVYSIRYDLTLCTYHWDFYIIGIRYIVYLLSVDMYKTDSVRSVEPANCPTFSKHGHRFD